MRMALIERDLLEKEGISITNGIVKDFNKVRVILKNKSEELDPLIVEEITKWQQICKK